MPGSFSQRGRVTLETNASCRRATRGGAARVRCCRASGGRNGTAFAALVKLTDIEIFEALNRWRQNAAGIENLAVISVRLREGLALFDELSEREQLVWEPVGSA